MTTYQLFALKSINKVKQKLTKKYAPLSIVVEIKSHHFSIPLSIIEIDFPTPYFSV